MLILFLGGLKFGQILLWGLLKTGTTFKVTLDLRYLGGGCQNWEFFFELKFKITEMAMMKTQTLLNQV